MFTALRGAMRRLYAATCRWIWQWNHLSSRLVVVIDVAVVDVAVVVVDVVVSVVIVDYASEPVVIRLIGFCHDRCHNTASQRGRAHRLAVVCELEAPAQCRVRLLLDGFIARVIVADARQDAFDPLVHLIDA